MKTLLIQARPRFFNHNVMIYWHPYSATYFSWSLPEQTTVSSMIRMFSPGIQVCRNILFNNIILYIFSSERNNFTAVQMMTPYMFFPISWICCYARLTCLLDSCCSRPVTPSIWVNVNQQTTRDISGRSGILHLS